MAALNTPRNTANSVFEKMDADNDGKVSRSELKVFVSAKIGRLRRAFDAVDANGDGRINSTEILKVLDAAHLKATVEDVEVLVRVMKGVKGGQGGAGGTGGAVGAVTFPQFLATFALLEPLDMVAMFDKEATLFELGSAGDLSQLLKGKTLTRRQTQALQQKVAAGEQNLPLRLFAAGVAATLAQTACQPIETIKVRLQNEANLANAAKRYNGFLRGGMAVARDEGILALWKGMLPSALREMSYSSIRFGLYAPIKKMMIGDKVSPAEVPLWKKIVAGGAAGGLGSAIANPTDLLKIRMQADSEVVAKRMSAHVADIYREGGVAGFWMGTSTTVARAVVLGATKLATYDEAKLRLKRLTGMEGLPLQTAAGAMAGFAYVCTSAPVDFTRTRLMTARQMAKQVHMCVCVCVFVCVCVCVCVCV